MNKGLFKQTYINFYSVTITIDKNILFTGKVITITSAVESQPIGSCRVLPEGGLSCSLITNGSCDHSMDLGVMCRTEYEQLYNDLRSQCSTANSKPSPPATAGSPTRSTSSPIAVTSKSCDCPTHTMLTPTSTFPLPCNQAHNVSGNIAESMGDSSVSAYITVAYGTVIVVLVTVIVAMGIGWICTCVILKRHSWVVKSNNQ